eukprot:superscaffoldBa00003173_g16312
MSGTYPVSEKDVCYQLWVKTSSTVSREQPQSTGLSGTSTTTKETSGSSNGSSRSNPLPLSSTTFRPMDSVTSSNKNAPLPPVFSTSPLSSPKIQRATRSPPSRSGSESSSYSQQSPKQSPHTPRRNSPQHYNRSPRGSITYIDRSPSSSPTVASFDQSSRSSLLHSSNNLLSPYDNSQMGRRSPRPDRTPSPLSFNHPMSNTLPRNFGGFRQPDEGMQRQKSPGKWNETDLDVSYERKPHHTYDKTEWLRPSVPNSNWRESNLDGPPPTPNPKKDPRSQSLQYSQGSLPRNTRISVPPDVSSPYHPQPILSRISIPPTSTQSRQRRPIPLSVIMRLQNPHWGAMATRHPRVLGAEGDMAPYQPAMSVPREFFHQPVFQPQQPPPELRQPAIYSDVLNPGDIDAELERLDFVHHIPVISENPSMPQGVREVEQGVLPAPRPLSPTRLQPVVAPEAQSQEIPNLEELLRIRAEIPRALKRRGSVDHPLVLLLDGALVGELETVQRAVQEMNDPSQPNDEGITALHNAICGGHYNVVDFLVRIGANVSAPDSHGWTPLHCAASCNDRPLCEFLVRNGAAVMAVTESDSATAAQKCDPYAVGFEECENFLRGVEEAMGLENSGVLYALWNYPAQAADELSFKEGDMVTILQKPEGSDWWWASLCGREGFVPNNYFG